MLIEWKSDNMINFIVCDNESEITNLVKNIITKAMFKTNIDYRVHIFNEYDSKFNKIVKSDLENKIYILDIEVGKYSGIDVAKNIRKNDWNSIILILTAHYELEYVAYRSKILLFDFISKFDLYDKQVYETINTCVNAILKEDKLSIKYGRRYEKINYNDILYITYANRKLKIITKSKEYETNYTLKEIKEKLKGKFIYTHRSCIVNLSNIKYIDIVNRNITFINNTKTDLLSRNYIKDVKEYANS